MAIVALGSAGGRWIMSACILASAMAFIDATALNVVLPSLQQSLQAKGTDIFWILNAYLLMLAAFVLLGGSLGDKLGRKKIFMIGIFAFILGSVACGFSTSVNMLIAFRAVQGLGGALMIPGSLSITLPHLVTKSGARPSVHGQPLLLWLPSVDQFLAVL